MSAQPKEYFVWDEKEMAISCLTKTPLNLWSMVANGSIASEAMSSVFGDPTFYNGNCSDRLFLWRLASKGPILIGREVGLFYRLHGESEPFRQGKDSQACQSMAHLVNSTIQTEGLKRGFDARKEWFERYGDSLARGMLRSLQLPDESNALFLMEGRADTEPSLHERLRSVIYDWTPPALLPKVQNSRTKIARFLPRERATL